MIQKNDIKIVVTVLAVLLASELLFTMIQELFSKNIAQIQLLPETAAKIHNAKNTSVLFLGNSLTANAVDETMVEELYNRNYMNKKEFYKMVPDSTNIWDWYCIVKNQFRNQSQMPDRIINGFAWAQLSDSAVRDPSRLGYLFCDLKDLPDLYSLGMTGIDEIGEYIVATILGLYANREDISKRLLSFIIPYYQESVRYINAKGNNAPVDENIGHKKYTFNVLTKLLTSSKNRETKFIFIAMPLTYHYSMPEDLVPVLEDNGGIMLDYRNDEIFTINLYRDEIHLNEDGRKIFSKRLLLDLE